METFFIKVENPLWDLDDAIITIAIQDLKNKVGQKVYGKMMSEHTLTPQQINYMRKVMHGYLRDSLIRCMDYAKRLKLILKPSI